MANIKLSRPQNVASSFYVDSTCIDCGTCYWVSPDTYKRDDGASAVYNDPLDSESFKSAYRALLSCPTSSIGVNDSKKLDTPPADLFPNLIEENVFHTGFHSEKSFGAASYMIQREEGNILIDSPRMLNLLKRKIHELGGLKFQYLTHRDDIADSDLYHEEFGSKRIIHKGDKIERTDHYELFIEGDAEYKLAEDLIIIPVPGHTEGHSVLLYKNKYLFTGDHLCWSTRLNQLYAFKNHCWFNFEEQIKSMEKLLDYNFEWVLPGHGSPIKLSQEKMKEELQKCIEWMKE
ncbi:MAG: MBL fold metallo-hydrolase [Bacteriovoracaceae bacterium]|nr:MBL fold metallo-hydrolase [Bacteriovoracaceae bacterium]